MGQWRQFEKSDTDALEKALEANAIRDRKSPAENLLPLRHTHVDPVTFLTDISKYFNSETFVHNLLGSKLNDVATLTLQCAALYSSCTQELSYSNNFNVANSFLILCKTLQFLAI